MTPGGSGAGSDTMPRIAWRRRQRPSARIRCRSCRRAWTLLACGHFAWNSPLSAPSCFSRPLRIVAPWPRVSSSVREGSVSSARDPAGRPVRGNFRDFPGDGMRIHDALTVVGMNRILTRIRWRRLEKYFLTAPTHDMRLERTWASSGPILRHAGLESTPSWSLSHAVLLACGARCDAAVGASTVRPFRRRAGVLHRLGGHSSLDPGHRRAMSEYKPCSRGRLRPRGGAQSETAY